MKLKTRALASVALLALPCLLQAQPSAHYVPGVEGIKGASLPPPGFYVRDYNAFYFADQLNDKNGDKIGAVDVDAFIYANVPRLVWITDAQVLGGSLGLDALIPIQYASLTADTPDTPGKEIDEDTFGAGDFFVEGTWSKHMAKCDLSLGYGVWAPTGDSSRDHPTRPGAGYWTHMFTAGITYYPDKEKLWALSALSRYEINHQDRDTDQTPGQAYTLEWGLSRSLRKTIDVGVVGYYQQQVTEDYGRDASKDLDQVAAVGPEISAFCSKLGLFTSVRYLYEFVAKDRLQGHTVVLTLTKRL